MLAEQLVHCAPLYPTHSHLSTRKGHVSTRSRTPESRRAKRKQADRVADAHEPRLGDRGVHAERQRLGGVGDVAVAGERLQRVEVGTPGVGVLGGHGAPADVPDRHDDGFADRDLAAQPAVLGVRFGAVDAEVHPEAAAVDPATPSSAASSASEAVETRDAAPPRPGQAQSARPVRAAATCPRAPTTHRSTARRRGGRIVCPQEIASISSPARPRRSRPRPTAAPARGSGRLVVGRAYLLQDAEALVVDQPPGLVDQEEAPVPPGRPRSARPRRATPAPAPSRARSRSRRRGRSLGHAS